MIKLSDYVADFLVRQGVTTIFTVSGGGIMHLLDSVGRKPGLRYICNYHEQACAISAEAFARMNGGIGVCVVTTGPGSTNALSGIAGAWVDSVPVVVISGQVRRDLIADYSKVRQFGPQEINIVDMARTVTKNAVTVLDPGLIRAELERAFHLAGSGRPGPVWVNLPLDIQAAMIDETSLMPYDPGSGVAADPVISTASVEQVLGLLRQSRRPALICGNGVHLSGAVGVLQGLIDTLDIPVLSTIGGMDLVPESHPAYMGRFGPIGQRRANFVIQNADLLLSLGASMSVSCVGFNTAGFAPKARKIMVNIDPEEIAKAAPRPDLGIVADVGDFMRTMLGRLAADPIRAPARWKSACAGWRERYPALTPDYFEDPAHVNSYVFVDALSDHLAEQDAVLTGNSLDAWSVYQAFKAKPGQRIFTNINYGAMGWDLPALAGACFAREGKRTILITGDGSIQFNIQELMVIGRHRMNVKIFVFNNRGYESIRSTQTNYFGGFLVGADNESGVSNPDFEKLAEAYGLGFQRIRNNDEVRAKLGRLLESEGPVLCEVNLSYEQGRTPKVVSRRKSDGTMESGSLENMFPFLPDEEVHENMHMFDDKG